MDQSEWVNLAREITLDMLDHEFAVTVREMEARASDRLWPGAVGAPNPHHFTTARNELRYEGIIEATAALTRGAAGPVSVWHRVPRRGISGRIAGASARKRLLHARYLGWAQGSGRHLRGMIGPAGERVARRALREASDLGYTPTSGGWDTEVVELLGVKVPGGPLDAAAHLTVADPVTHLPTAYTLPIEVKNIREWVYAESSELHQVLFKAARIQQAQPAARIVPVLITRRRQDTALRMGQDLGFYSIQRRTCSRSESLQTSLSSASPRFRTNSGSLTSLRQRSRHGSCARHSRSPCRATRPSWQIAGRNMDSISRITTKPSGEAMTTTRSAETHSRTSRPPRS